MAYVTCRLAHELRGNCLLARCVCVYRLVLKDYHRCGLLTLFIVWIAAMLGILYQYVYHER